MYQSPSRVQLLLEELSGPGLLGFLSFFWLVFLGIAYLPMRFVFVAGLWIYHVLLWLHARGERMVLAYDRYLDPQRTR